MKFLYARVSSLGQNEERQLVDTEQYDRTYLDKCSGKNIERPQLEAMLKNLRAGDVGAAKNQKHPFGCFFVGLLILS